MENSQKRLYIQIANKLAEEISAGEIKPGERFPSERDLAVKYDVSRSTIREAMIALEVNKLVEIRTGSGIYALEPGESNPIDLSDELPSAFEILETRLILETEAAKLAASRISNSELHQLKQLATAMQSASEQGDIAKAEKIDQMFHLTIVRATRNNALISLYEWLWQARQTSVISKQFHHKLRQNNSDAVLEEHRQMLNALMQRNEDLAKATTMHHLKEVEKRLATDSFS
ncbi:FadR family transcriptional regulator [Catenovulum sp. 2E275]|uniref:FadR/GntR family transcriptional regulator n=1 Tax=Catenovulum sp. 2E275 TaxID=2980497 RepID=UPI0021D3440E|nr:FadR/GntR family transcriptional regulator [Catenovulum sp. 2E275]MCU4677629.1 FadR family transcriptional regulator [Catenovulum sp. 2E275]